MAEAYIGEIRMAGFNFAPAGWLACDGSLVNISEYETLFTLLDTRFGGDGVNTFGLPDLRGRVPIHQGTGGGQVINLAQQIGSEFVTLQAPQVGTHRHTVLTGSSANSANPGSNVMLGDVGGSSSVVPAYGPAASLTGMATQSIGPSGGGQPHENRQPFLTVNFIIAASGIYPVQS